MARLALWLAVVLSLFVIAGCGGDDDGGDASPLGNALAYAPADSPFVVAIDTDVEGSQFEAIQAIGERFPFADQARDALEETLSEEDLDFEQDLKPVLGNEFVVAGTDVRSLTDEGDDDDFVGAIEVGDQEALDNFVEKSNLDEIGEESGATLYESEDGDISAVDGDTLVVAASRQLLEEALARHDGDDSLSTEDFESGVEDLPAESLVRGYFDVAGLIEAEEGGEQALEIPYLAAADTFGFSAAAEQDAISVDFRLSTDGEELSEDELPLASGTESPEVLEGKGKIGAGLRDPLQILTFGENAGQAVDPSGFGDYNTGKETIERQIDVDIEEDVLGQADEVAMRFSLDGTFALRASLEDGPAFKRTLDKLGRTLPDLLESSVGGSVGYSAANRNNDFYALSLPGGESIVYGVFDGAFVLSNDSGEAGALSVSGETSPVEGAEGAVTMRADAQEVANAALRQFGSQLGVPGGGAGASLFTEPLGDLTGFLTAEPEATTGNITLTFD
ncbi:hypothetical protein BH20ACT19_BH20ACT19_00430 [soil metagenome]